jgi:hypothetical protein
MTYPIIPPYISQPKTMETSLSSKPVPYQRRSTILQLTAERQDTIIMMPDLPRNQAKKRKAIVRKTR